MKRNMNWDWLKKSSKTALCAVLAGGMVFGGLHAYSSLNSYEVLAAGKEPVYLTKAEDTEEEEDKEEKEEKEDTGERAKGNLDVSDLVEDAMPSVVSITTKSVEEMEYYYGMFNFYGYAPRTTREVTSSASGIIIGENDTELLLVTNYHVVKDAELLSVCFCDNKAYEAKVKGTDEDKDLAVIAVPLEKIDDDTYEAIKIATIGSSDDLKLGEQVVVIGNAMGYGQSVTTGIVSAKNRQMDDSDEEDGLNLIQTDAAINPGNSGGAMLNMDGEVVGISSSKLASTTVEGMCYAIAISDVEDILNELMNEEMREKVGDDHGVLGIKATTVSSEAHQMYKIPQGVYVAEVDEGGAAEEAGLKQGSIITKFNGRSVKSVEALIEKLEYYEVGEEVELTVAVHDGDGYAEDTVTVKLQKSTAVKDDEEEEEDQDSRDDRENRDEDSEDSEDRKDDGEDYGEDDWFSDFFGGEEDDFGYGSFGEWN